MVHIFFPDCPILFFTPKVTVHKFKVRFMLIYFSGIAIFMLSGIVLPCNQNLCNYNILKRAPNYNDTTYDCKQYSYLWNVINIQTDILFYHPILHYKIILSISGIYSFILCRYTYDKYCTCTQNCTVLSSDGSHDIKCNGPVMLKLCNWLVDLKDLHNI